MAALASVGVNEDCRNDIQLALAEACGNVIRHAGPGDDYSVTIWFDTEQCTIEVVDNGSNAVAGQRRSTAPTISDDAGLTMPLPTDDSGRGLHLIRMVADRFDMRSDQRGTALRFVKRLAWTPDAPLRRMTGF
jgi:serine/threonine-protein kinase RsbW